ncbi:hypothetical protein EDB19DRAFT_79436 [Suillus lakei]|nr:hypothetical protein EDB19DRAFT_79436 [Suillus lakei]
MQFSYLAILVCSISMMGLASSAGACTVNYSSCSENWECCSNHCGNDVCGRPRRLLILPLSLMTPLPTQQVTPSKFICLPQVTR